KRYASICIGSSCLFVRPGWSRRISTGLYSTITGTDQSSTIRRMAENLTDYTEGRSPRKHREILDAAQDAFITKGYDRATMDDIAAAAGVSKQTVYKHFADKEGLFAEIVLGTTARLSTLVTLITDPLGTTTDLRRDLERLAKSFLTDLMQPDVLRLRRLVISCADRFPTIGR